MAIWSFPKRPEDIYHNATAEWRWDIPSKSDDVYHHGILGQKWGEKHGPPYPLGSKTSSRIKKKGIKARQKRYKDRQDKIKSGKLKPTANDNIGMSMYMEQSHDNNWQEVERRQYEDGSYGYFTPAQVVKDIAYDEKTGTLSIDKLEASYRYHDPSNNNSPTDKNGELTERAVTGGDVVNGRVNANFGDKGTTNNCMKCTAALALQQWGIEAMAGRNSHGINKAAFEYWFDGAVNHDYVDSRDIDKVLSTQGPGAFGKVGISYSGFDDAGAKKRTGGHAIFYRVNNDGKVKYYDGQNPDASQWKFDSYADVAKYNGADLNLDANYTRLDNTKPNWDHLGEDGVFRLNPATNAVGKVRNKNDGRIVDRW